MKKEDLAFKQIELYNKGFGAKKWAISAGFIPLKSTGKEPAFVSQEKVALLNVSKSETLVRVTVFMSDGEPVGEFELELKAQRVLKFRVNDLIDPHAIPLGKSFGMVLESEAPIVVQVSRHHTRQGNLAIMGTMAYGEK
jgi:hypothetical protein